MCVVCGWIEIGPGVDYRTNILALAGRRRLTLAHRLFARSHQVQIVE